MLSSEISQLPVRAKREEGRWIVFEPLPPKPKTGVWSVVSKEHGVVLGAIQWFGRWRGYAFFPGEDMVFEPRCLIDIAEFINRQNAAKRER